MTTPTGSLEPDLLVHDRYRVVRQIGRGGMGAVYEAVDSRLGNTVALKQTLVRGAQLDDAFAREARLLSSLRHPALPVVSDYFAEGEGHFLVMQFIPGTDLGTLMAQRSAPFSFGEVLPWADQLLDALDYLHSQTPPIVHRDLKPQNLKLTPRDEIVLLDFGLAKGGTTGLDATKAEGASLFGYTPQYAPLEQIQATGTDPRSDLYSLAATLYALLAHKAPPNALDRAAAVLQGASDPLRPLVELNPQVPQAVSALLVRCMALAANNRPASAAAVRAELADAIRTGAAGAATAGMRTIIQPPPESAQVRITPPPGLAQANSAPPPPLTPGPSIPTSVPPPNRAWLPLLIVGIVGLLLVAVLGGALLFLAKGFVDGPPPGTVIVAVDAPTAVSTVERPTVAVPTQPVSDGPLPNVAATMAAVEATANAAFTEAQQTAQTALGGDERQRPGAALGRVSLEFGEKGTGDGFLDDPRGVAIGPDGAIYVADYSNRRIQRFSPKGKFERSFFVKEDRPILALAADRQGRVLVAQNSQVSVFDGKTGKLVTTFTDSQGNGFEDLEVLGDGSLIAIPWAGDDLVRLSAEGVETGRIKHILKAADAEGSPQAVAADGLGTLYILADQGQTVYIFGSDGAFRDKFSVSDANAFGEIAVDGQGRIYVPGFFKGVQVFAPDGRPLDVIRLPGSAFDLTFDDQDNLYAATNAPKVVKLQVRGQ